MEIIWKEQLPRGNNFTMSDSHKVRFSRGGDQFHYLWAARRCLKLLDPVSNLVAVTIEGASPQELTDIDPIDKGEEVIDVAEYYGSENIGRASKIRYIQLKHSTTRASIEWAPSDYKKTINKFATRYQELLNEYSSEDLAEKLEFWFVSNRYANTKFIETIRDVAKANSIRHQANLIKLEQYTKLNGQYLADFCKLLVLENRQDGYWEQRNILSRELCFYLSGSDVDAPVQLKELISFKALPESADNPSITRMDVLRVLKADESQLFPAPCLIEDLTNVVPREQETELIEKIVESEGIPVIIHADGGVGKSIICTRIILGLPEGSYAVLFDCFGNATYRNVSKSRHRHKEALVQMANELASKALCYPLIPSPHSDSRDYVKAFLSRLEQSVKSLRAFNSKAILCIIVDAADNAQMAAEEIGESRSFILDLIREELPNGVRLVALCRTHRKHLLNPPYNALDLELLPFSRTETAAYLKSTFSDASESDIDEFHRLSSHNPRVQAMALEKGNSIAEVLRKLGPNPTTVDGAIGDLLNQAIDALRDEAVPSEESQIERICTGLATLRPLIPISVLASMSGVSPSAIKSFAFDLGRPLTVTGDTIQFLDEPAETWFRERFRPQAADLQGFVESLKPLSSTSPYVASSLPQLMLEAGLFDELVALALSSEGLPDVSPLERRDVELQRLQFALKASLRAKRYTEAAKMALKAGGESAGEERRHELLQENTDLAGALMDYGSIQEIVSRRTFGSGWTGSHHAYEAGLMSGKPELYGDARSRLRMAHEWIRNWSRRPGEERKLERIANEDIAEVAMVHFNLHGADECAWNFRMWKPRTISFQAGRILSSRFVDQGRYKELDELAIAAGNDLYLILAITLELRRVHRIPPEKATRRALRLAMSPRVIVKGSGHWHREHEVLQAMTSLAEAAHIQSVADEKTLATLIQRYLPDSPPRELESSWSQPRSPVLQAYTLHAAFSGQPLAVTDLAYPELRKRLEEDGGHSYSRNEHDFIKDMSILLPWYRLWGETVLGRIPIDDMSAAIETAKENLSKETQGNYYHGGPHTYDEIASLWLNILVEANCLDEAFINAFDNWVDSLNRPLFTNTLIQLARLSARTKSLGDKSLKYASEAFHRTMDERESAEIEASTYIKLARAVFPVSNSEAGAYFDQAIEVSVNIGDENIFRWDAILQLADRGSNPHRPNPEMAYNMARCAELTYHYVARDKYFDWDATVEALGGLCPSSSFAILSRWRDRGFGWANRLLPVLVDFLSDQGQLDPLVALALYGFRANWKPDLLLDRALNACDAKADKEKVSTFLHNYMVFQEDDARNWQKIKDISLAHDITIINRDDLIALNERREQYGKPTQYTNVANGNESLRRKESQDWEAIFAGIDLSQSRHYAIAYQRFRASEPPYHYDRFFEEARARIKIGKEAEFLKALAQRTEFSLWDFRSLIDCFPEDWKDRPAITNAMSYLLKAACKRFCLDISRYHYHKEFSLKPACDLSGVTEEEVFDIVISAIGKTTEPLDTQRLFTLIGLLAPNLSHDESLEVLTFGLGLFERTLKDEDGDGPWSERLKPPAEIEDAVAGYIWASLASPRTRLRWEAAHVVRGICELGQDIVLGHLVELFRGKSYEAFADAELFFYKFHACQWLLIALARAAKDNPDVLLTHAEFLLKEALDGSPHVLLRAFAARAALALLESDLLEGGSDLRQRLVDVNASTFPFTESKRYGKALEKNPYSEEVMKQVQFGFWPDVGRYWLAPLGECFAKSQGEIEYLVWDVIVNHWKYLGGASWDSDERLRRKIIRDQETHHSHGSYPQVDDVRFYFSYHAMMIVAGKLLSEAPVIFDPEYPTDQFTDWLTRHDITREDGYWVADRRDPPPLEWPDWKDDRETEHWRWSIWRNDFERVLMTQDGRINVWGDWAYISGYREETVCISSALVSPDRSEALLRALQSATDPSEYGIPAAGDELEIDQDGFHLKGWVFRPDSHIGIDKRDPWAGGIVYPTGEPARFVVELMNLMPDREHRTWSFHHDDREYEALWAQTWGNGTDEEQGTETESGYRLQISFNVLRVFLKEVKMDMIVEVELDRGSSSNRYHKKQEGFIEHIPKSARLFLFKAGGDILAI
jgi:hypothetical protein